jgi:hypothetical protein
VTFFRYDTGDRRSKSSSHAAIHIPVFTGVSARIKEKNASLDWSPAEKRIRNMLKEGHAT